MIQKVTIRNFKRFREEVFDLSDAVVLAGPNNTGKSTLLQALSAWALARDRWRLKKGPVPRESKRAATPLTRKDFTALPLREFDLLWHERSTALSKDERADGQKPGEPRLIEIAVQGLTAQRESWNLTMELRYQGPEQIYVKPLGPSGPGIPEDALDTAIVHCPPFSGIGAEERRLDRGAQNHELGKGKPGEILRNLLWEVHHERRHWESLVQDVQELFGFTLLAPEYEEALTPFILCEYLAGVPQGKGGNTMQRYDVASGGSGFHQILLLLSFFYARPASVLLLDEPDAHLHVILQRQIHDRLREVAQRRGSQLVIATHSEVILDGTSPDRIISFLGAPHPLVNETQRDQVREAMAELTSLDLLLAEQHHAVLYCEGDSDFKILRACADRLDHPSRSFFAKPFFHPNGGRNPRGARRHLFALRAVYPDMRGLLVLDGDNRGLPDHEVTADGMTVVRWARYEIENYLLVPAAIARFLAPDPTDLFGAEAARAATEYLRGQLPPQTFEHPLTDNATVVAVRASKELLPQTFKAAGRALEKNDFFLIAEVMRPEEIHTDVVTVLDRIVDLMAR